MTVMMRDALKPNLLQTLENTPVLVHCRAVRQHRSPATPRWSPTGSASTGGDFLVTEAGFGADMGAEKFFNIKCRTSGLRPDAAVVVATVRALKAHSGQHRIVRRQGRCRPSSWRRTPTTCTRGAPTSASRSRTSASTACRRWWHQRVPHRPRFRARRHPGDRRVDGGPRARSATTSARGARARPSWPRRWPKRPRSERLPVPLTGRGIAAGEDRDHRDPGLRRCRRRLRPAAARATRPATSATASAGSDHASPRPTCRSPPTRR